MQAVGCLTQSVSHLKVCQLIHYSNEWTASEWRFTLISLTLRQDPQIPISFPQLRVAPICSSEDYQSMMMHHECKSSNPITGNI